MEKAESARERILFVTGRLAAPALRELVVGLGADANFEPAVAVAKVSVAALMTPDWLIGKIQVPPGIDRVILPGKCSGDLSALRDSIGGIPVERGPKDFRDLPAYFMRPPTASSDYGRFDIEILAEINHADRMTASERFAVAERYRADGADVIDLGCSPGSRWTGVADAVRELIDHGFRISIDTFDIREAADATAAGASLVLSVNSANRNAAPDWNAHVVAVPDEHDGPDWIGSLERTAEYLDKHRVPFRLDPILEPIGFGFAKSLNRYFVTRERFPGSAILMGIGNLTELTEADSVGVNALLIGYCQELGIQSVLTTEVIPWASGSVREIAIARALMKFAVDRQTLPKHVDSRLVALREGPAPTLGDAELHRLQGMIADRNFRIFAENGKITVMNHERMEQDVDPFPLFDRLNVEDASHAFYLGWEMMKAATALQLGKRYVQDESLRWGYSTREEWSHRERKPKQAEPPE